MPELPEVETIKRQLEKSLVNKKIKDVFVYLDKMVLVGSKKLSNVKIGSRAEAQKFAAALKGKKIIGFDRRAKYLIIRLSGAHFLIIHLRMSGQLIYLDKKSLSSPMLLSLAKTAIAQILPSKHTHVEFLLTDGGKIFYNDTRQFGHIRLVDQKGFNDVMQQAQLGPEPLSITLKDFKKLVLSHPEKRAKDFLLNQQIIAGIGNIYADESLFGAKISPLRKMRTLRDDQIKNLHSSIQAVLKKAIKFGGSSIEYFLMTNGTAGKYSEEHLVYAKAKQPCPGCSRPLKSKKVGSRTTVFCANCQK